MSQPKPKIALRDLHRLHDGELSLEERGRVEQVLNSGFYKDDEVRVAALGDMGSLLRNTLETEAGGVDLWAGIETRLPRPARNPRTRPRMVFGGAFMAVAAALLLWVGPFGPTIASDGCDIDELEVTGAAVTVLKVPDGSGSGTTTVVWIDEGDEQ